MAAQQETPKSTAKPPKTDGPAGAKPSAEAKPARKAGKLLWIVAAVVVLGGLAGGGWAFLHHGGSEAAPVVQEPPAFVPLETFTVNLLPSDGLQQYLQVSVTLKVPGQSMANAVKGRMPEVRNRILMLLSGKKAAELMSVSGKEKLAVEVATAARGIVEPSKDAAAAPANAEPAPASGSERAAAEGTTPAQTPRAFEVLFTAFIIQ